MTDLPKEKQPKSMKPENGKYWKVLRGEQSLTQGLVAFGIEPLETFLGMGTNIDSFFMTCSFVRHMAYQKLVEEGEINPEEVFNTGYGTNELPVEGDMGYMGEKVLTYWNGKWY